MGAEGEVERRRKRMRKEKDMKEVQGDSGGGEVGGGVKIAGDILEAEGSGG